LVGGREGRALRPWICVFSRSTYFVLIRHPGTRPRMHHGVHRKLSKARSRLVLANLLRVYMLTACRRTAAFSAVSMSTLPPGAVLPPACLSPGRSPTCAVIGGGAAGLASGRALRDAGMDVTILERAPAVRIH
jgi:NADPH-dependent 2,4-dienoyl-CoA reductase/sulfur reductase-like enzyme